MWYTSSMGINSENSGYMMQGSFSGFEAFNEMSGQDRFMEFRAEQMYRKLAEKGEFSQIDKAKHNANYRNYLLANYDSDDYF